MGRIKEVEKVKKERRKLRVGYFLRHFAKKHRLSVRDQHTDTEISYVYISSLRIALAAVGLLVALSVLVISIVVYTPVLDTLPGTPGRKSREILIANVMRLDSLQNVLTTLTQYGENVSLVMEGKTPEVRTMNRLQENLREEKELVAPSAADSLLRAQIEAATGRYALETDAYTGSAAATRTRMSFGAPVSGTVTSQFNPATRMYGTGITPTGPQQVVASAGGTVIMSAWTLDEDYVIQIQHKDNYVTVYKHATQLLKAVGDRVDAGEVIGYVEPERITPVDGRAEFVFEIWNDGVAIDPQKFIYFQ